MMPHCEICSFLPTQQLGTPDVLMQTDRWVGVLDRNQGYLGKSFVTLRQHKGSIAELGDVDWRELHQIMRALEVALKAAFSMDVANWECLMNNAAKAGEPTHVHWHLFPRYVNGTSFQGEEFPDPKWPRHLEKPIHPVSEELFQAIGDALRAQIRP